MTSLALNNWTLYLNRILLPEARQKNRNELSRKELYKKVNRKSQKLSPLSKMAVTSMQCTNSP